MAPGVLGALALALPTPAGAAVQLASSPREILAVVSERRGELAPSFAAHALLRAANTLRQPRDSAARCHFAREAGPLFSSLAPLVVDEAVPLRGLDELLQAAAILGTKLPDCVFDRVADVGEDVLPQVATSLEWSCQRLGRTLPEECTVARLVAGLPFRAHAAWFRDVDFAALLEELRAHLAREEVVLGDGRKVPETRLTAWFSSLGTRLSYSGKVMQAAGHEGPLLGALRRRVSRRSGVAYDGVLVNLYEHGKVGMRFHQDPDQRTVFTTDTHVASFGASRAFVLRPAGRAVTDERHTFLLAHGDVMEMNTDCQERFQHAVRGERDEEDAGERVSLVFKQTRVDARR